MARYRWTVYEDRNSAGEVIAHIRTRTVRGWIHKQRRTIGGRWQDVARIPAAWRLIRQPATGSTAASNLEVSHA